MMAVDAPASVQIIPRPELWGGYRLDSRVWLPAPLDEVFPFFSDATQLETLTPPWINFRIVTPQPIDMRAGLLIDYRLKIRGFPMRWRSVISVWDPPRSFVDEQVRGPYRSWHHLHAFEPSGDGTLVIDQVDYAVWGGAWIHRWFVRGDLLKIFEFRQKKLLEIFRESPG